jgi:hypothetical protein
MGIGGGDGECAIVRQDRDGGISQCEHGLGIGLGVGGRLLPFGGGGGTAGRVQTEP